MNLPTASLVASKARSEVKLLITKRRMPAATPTLAYDSIAIAIAIAGT